MRLKLTQFFAGLIIYSLFGLLMVWIAGKGFKGQWHFIVFWTVGMALMHVFFIEPMRLRMAKRKEAQPKK